MKKDLFVYVGTYTEPIRFGTGQILKGKGEGIYLFRMDLETGALELLHKTVGVVNPSYLTLAPSKKHLYAVNELKEYQGKVSGAVSSFKIDPVTGTLDFINQRATQGTDPCHVVVDDSNTHLFVSNFASGSVCVFPIEEGGGIGEAVQFIQHEGSSINPIRQSGPHAHSLIFDLSNKYAFVPDLGKDMLMVYKYSKDMDTPLIPGETPWVSCIPGAGPRHCVFHPLGEFCYLINELDSTIATFKYNQENGNLELLQIVPSLPDRSDIINTCADIHITPDGQFLYGSNRGHNSIIIYRVDASTGMLTYIGWERTYGRIPRNFAIDPTGTFLLAANQDTDNIVVFRIESKSGRLTKVSEVEVPTPVCVKPYIWD